MGRRDVGVGLFGDTPLSPFFVLLSVSAVLRSFRQNMGVTGNGSDGSRSVLNMWLFWLWGEDAVMALRTLRGVILRGYACLLARKFALLGEGLPVVL